MKIIKPSFTYVTNMTPEHIEELVDKVEKAYRVCYASEPKGNRDAFITNKIRMGHESPLEHSNITIEVITNRGVTHEIVRHRIGAYSQQSTRYCNYSQDKFGNELTFMKPEWVSEESVKSYFENPRAEDTPEQLFLNSCSNSEADYLELLENGWKPEQCREVLNNALATTIIMTYNIRTWRHFFNLRVLGTTGKPHPNMEYTFAPVLKDFAEKMPIFFGDLWEQYEAKLANKK